MPKTTVYGLFFLLILAACSPKTASQLQSEKDPDLMERADALAHRLIITDGHIDLPYRLKVKNFRLTREYIGIPVETEEGDFDYLRAKEGGLDAPFMSIYIPASYQREGGAKALADSLIGMVEGIAEAHPDKFAVATSPDQVEENFSRGLVSLPMGMENGAPVEEDLANVQYFHKRGIRYITLTHSKDNQICDSSYDTTGTWGGLSPFGRQVVEEMNRVGIMVDISHVSDNAFYDVMEITRAPAIASHSSCRKFTPGFERNMSDDMIRRLAENGGVIQINFGSSFLDSAYQRRDGYLDEKRTELRELMAQKDLRPSDPEAGKLIADFQRKNPGLFADVQLVADHIDHVVSLVGVDHVGLGSDYDGVGDSLPTGLKDVSQYPNLIYELLRRGYSEEDIAKICHRNVFRVWREVERVAAEE